MQLTEQNIGETYRTIAYFSMEIALEVGMPTYSGGLGVLAGDAVRAAADLHIPMVAVTLLHRQGYFSQRLAAPGWQHEVPATWAVEDFVHDMPARVEVTVEGRPVHLRAWHYSDEHEKASKRLASLQAMSPATERRYTASPPEFTRDKM